MRRTPGSNGDKAFSLHAPTRPFFHPSCINIGQPISITNQPVKVNRSIKLTKPPVHVCTLTSTLTHIHAPVTSPPRPNYRQIERASSPRNLVFAGALNFHPSGGSGPLSAIANLIANNRPLFSGPHICTRARCSSGARFIIKTCRPPEKLRRVIVRVASIPTADLSD